MFKSHQVRDAFLKFLVSVMTSYTKFLVYPKEKGTFTSLTDFFYVDHFLQSKKNITFLQKFAETSMFARFIEARTTKSENDHALVYFDEAIKSKSKNCFVQPWEWYKAYRVLPPKEPVFQFAEAEEHPMFRYQNFPKLKYELFPAQREVLKLASDPIKVPQQIQFDDKKLKQI